MPTSQRSKLCIELRQWAFLICYHVQFRTVASACTRRLSENTLGQNSLAEIPVISRGEETNTAYN